MKTFIFPKLDPELLAWADNDFPVHSPSKSSFVNRSPYAAAPGEKRRKELIRMLKKQSPPPKCGWNVVSAKIEIISCKSRAFAYVGQVVGLTSIAGTLRQKALPVIA